MPSYVCKEPRLSVQVPLTRYPSKLAFYLKSPARMSSYEPAMISRPQRLKMEEYAFRADVQAMFQVRAADTDLHLLGCLVRSRRARARARARLRALQAAAHSPGPLAPLCRPWLQTCFRSSHRLSLIHISQGIVR